MSVKLLVAVLGTGKSCVLVNILTKTGSGLAASFAMDAEGFSVLGWLGGNADNYLSVM